MNNTFIFLNSRPIGALGAILEDLAAKVSAGSARTLGPRQQTT
jgi:hypothetical protein